jgi:hypothetical protein
MNNLLINKGFKKLIGYNFRNINRLAAIPMPKINNAFDVTLFNKKYSTLST